MKKTPKKILLYTDTTFTGGAENHMLALATLLDREKFIPLLMCSGHTSLDHWCKKFKDAGVEVIRLIAKSKHNPRHYFSLKRALEELEIDLLHAHIWNPASGRYAYRASKSTKKPLLTTEHDPFLLSPLKNFLKKWLLKNISHVIAISEANKNLLREIYPLLREKISVIHNGLDITSFESQLLSFSPSEREKFRTEQFQVHKKTPVITCIAELHPRKGIIYLMEAAQILKKKGINFKIIMVGQGPQQKKLTKKIQKLTLQDHVKLLGYRKDIPHILASSDLFVLPSLNEAFGLVLLEAMAAKLPIIATKNGGIREIITNGVTGLLVPPADSHSLVYAIMRLLKNPKLANRLSITGNEYLKKHFDIKKMVKKTEEIYDKILGSS